MLQYPISAFSIDEDTGSCTSIHRMINQGMFPPEDAIIIEEFINYFDNDYTQQNEYENDVPFNIYMAIATSP